MKFGHLHVYCQELEPAIAFLTEGLNGELLSRRTMVDRPGAEIRMGGMVIYLSEMGREWAGQDYAARVCGYNHLGFFVDDLDAALARLCAMPGVTQDGEPFLVPAARRRCVYLVGPSNLHIELVENMK